MRVDAAHDVVIVLMRDAQREGQRGWQFDGESVERLLHLAQPLATRHVTYVYLWQLWVEIHTVDYETWVAVDIFHLEQGVILVAFDTQAHIARCLGSEEVAQLTLHL